jgi:hypothetical protein
MTCSTKVTRMYPPTNKFSFSKHNDIHAGRKM